MTNMFSGMYSHRRGPPPNRGGRGGGADNILFQRGNRTLVARNFSQEFDPVYQEFLEYKKQKEGETSYANIVANDDEGSSSNFGYIQNSINKVILTLNDIDLKWEDQPSFLLERYIQDYSDTVGAYKTRPYYENLLINCESCEFQHFHSVKPEIHNFSKITIKRIISIEEWGISPFKERSFCYEGNKTPVKYNYWDYLDSFNKVLLYQNDKKKHTWWIKICSKVYNQEIPNWFIDWWKFYGTNPNILPQKFKNYFEEWEKISPNKSCFNKDKVIPSLYFMVEFSIPYIWKWTVEVEKRNNIPYLVRNSQTKCWDRMFKTNPATKEIFGIETVQQIESSQSEYRKLAQAQTKGKDLMEINKLSKDQIIELYLEKMKKELAANYEDDKISNKSDKSMASCSSNNFHVLDDMQDAQDPNEPIPIEDLFEEIKESLKENICGKSAKKEGTQGK